MKLSYVASKVFFSFCVCDITEYYPEELYSGK